MAIVVFDLNRDGRPDLGVANFLEDTLSVLIGLGGASFEAARNFPVPVGPTALAAGDVDLDGVSDLVVANSQDNTIAVLRGHLNGGNPTLGSPVIVAANAGTSGVALGDMNGDGRLDLIVADRTGDVVRVMVGGSWDRPLPIIATVTVPGEPFDVAVGDLNRDGRLDLVVAARAAGNVSVVLGNGRGGFSSRMDYPATEDADPEDASPVSVEIGEITGDNHFDVLVTNEELEQITVLPGDGAGRLGDALSYAVGRIPRKAVVCDINADALGDVVVVNGLSDSISALLGTGGPELETAGDFGVGTNPRDVVVTDFNDDGKPDAATVNYDLDNVSLLLNTSTRPVIPGDLDGDQLRSENDLAVLTAEVFDGDGAAAFRTQLGYVATGAGADVNGDRRISAADVVALRRRVGR